MHGAARFIARLAVLDLRDRRLTHSSVDLAVQIDTNLGGGGCFGAIVLMGAVFTGPDFEVIALDPTRAGRARLRIIDLKRQGLAVERDHPKLGTALHQRSSIDAETGRVGSTNPDRAVFERRPRSILCTTGLGN